MATQPSTLADLFLQLWLRLRDDPPGFEAALAWQVAHAGQTLTRADSLDAMLSRSNGRVSAIERGWLDAAALSRAPADPVQRVLLLAQAIDRWHQLLSQPAQAPPSHARARHQLEKHHRLNVDDADWQVILRRPLWGRHSDPEFELPPGARGPWATFASLIAMPSRIEASDPDDENKKRSITLSYRLLDSTVLRMPPRNENWNPKVGFVPLAEQVSEVDLALREESDGQWYDTCVTDLSVRAARAIEVLCRNGAEIIVFPEMVIHPDTLLAISRAVAQHGPSSDLRLVVAGTRRTANDPAKPFNEAILLNHRGRQIGEQRKLHRWNLNSDLCSRYDVQLPIPLPADGQLREYITPGDEVLVIESAFGRMAVMICEDLARSEPGKWLRDNILFDWLFTPILDASVEPGRWIMNHGGKAALGGRCRVVIANSVPLTHRSNAVNRRESRPDWVFDHAGIGACYDIREANARYHVERHDLSAPADATYLVDWSKIGWENFTP